MALLATTPVYGAPLQYVDVFDADDVPAGVIEMAGLHGLFGVQAVGSRRVFALAVAPYADGNLHGHVQLLALARDPDTGTLDFENRITRRSGSSAPIARHPMPLGFVVTDAGTRAYLPGGALPAGCSVDCRSAQGFFAYLLDERGRTISEVHSDADRLGRYRELELDASPDGRFLYAVQRDGIRVFERRGDGALVEIETSPRQVRLEAAWAKRDRTGAIVDWIMSSDGRRAFIATGASANEKGGIVVYDLDESTGRLLPADALRSNDDIALSVRARLALSPDGSVLYATSRDHETGEGPSGVLRFAVGEDGTLDYLDLAPAMNPKPLRHRSGGSIPIALSSDGRQLFTLAEGQFLNKYTIGDDGTLAYRGYETDARDGVPAGTIGVHGVQQLLVARDGAHLYYLNGYAAISTWDNRADLGVEFLAGSSDEASTVVGVRVLNRGGATAHDVVLDVSSSSDLAATALPDSCRLLDESARCHLGALAALESAELFLTTAASDGAGAPAIVEATVAALEVDPDPSDNAAIGPIFSRVLEAAPADPTAAIGTVVTGGACGPPLLIVLLALSGGRRRFREMVFVCRCS